MYKLQVGCLLMTFFIMTIYFCVRRVKTRSHVVYSILLVLSCIYFLLDMLTVYTVNHLQTVPKVWNDVAHRLFITALVAVIYLIFVYIILMIDESRAVSWWWCLPLVISALLVGGLPLRYQVTPQGNYSCGPAANMAYFSVALYTGLTFYFLVRGYKKIPPQKRRIVLLTVLCEVGITLYQAVVPLSLISSMGIALVNLGFFMTVESPDVHLIERLIEEKRRADLANQAKSRFLANMSHEIRTPINAVIGMNEMILRESGEETITSYAADVHYAAKSLLGIINDILDFSKIESGKMEITPVEYPLSDTIMDLYNLIAQRAKEKGLFFVLNVDPALSSVLYGDNVRIKQIITNLLTNAVKYTEKGKVEFTVSGKAHDGVQELTVRIADTGIGIRKEDREKLFAAFERIEEKRNHNIEGIGLGMSITLSLLKLMDSELLVESEYGKGSAFTFTVKQKIINPAPVGTFEEWERRLPKEFSSDACFTAPDAKILIVDDNRMNRRVFTALLKRTQVQVTQAQSGMEALDLTREQRFDLIFMDHLMPDMDGIETLHQIRRERKNLCKDVPVVILTANAVVGAKEGYLAEGFDAYLAKPIESAKLETLIRECLPSKKIKAGA